MDALLPTPEDFEFAEERRLFYVAITRAKKRSYLIADMASSSVFIKELLNKDDYEIEDYGTHKLKGFEKLVQIFKLKTTVSA